ncbi:MAG: tetratricopeptide repeat protein [Bacteroidota bacterium]
MNSLTKKIGFLSILLLLFAVSLFAQDLKTANSLTNSEQFEAAKVIYEKLLKEQPNNGDVYYYYGEAYLKEYFTDSITVTFKEVAEPALALFNKGIVKDTANPLNFVGLGKVFLYNHKRDEAQAKFDKAISLLPTKKNKIVMTNDRQALVYYKIAESFTRVDGSDANQVNTILDKAEALDKNNPDIFIIRGDVYLFLNNDGSNAILNYKKAQSLDPKSPKARLRLGQLWTRAKKYTDAVGFYKEALEIDSTFAPAYRELAEIYSMAGQFENAKKNYSKFIELSSQNTYAKVRYASFMFLTKDYLGTIQLINEILQKDQSFNVLNRLLGYSYFETKDYNKGLVAIEKFFSNAKTNKIIASDYSYYARLLSKLGNDSVAIEKYKIAASLDTADMDLISEMAITYSKMKKYSEAAAMYEIKAAKGSATLTDFYSLGKAYYSVPDYVKADTTFGILISKKPDFMQAYLWRAYTNTNLDPDNKNALAKPWFESYINLAVADSVKNQKDLIQAYSYLAAYYLLQAKDYCKAKFYSDKIIVFDAKNERALTILKEVKNKCSEK